MNYEANNPQINQNQEQKLLQQKQNKHETKQQDRDKQPNQNQPKKNPAAAKIDVQEQVLNRLNKLEELEQAGQNPFWVTTAEQTEHSQEIIDNYAVFEGKEVSVAGRIMAKRGMGKVSFVDLHDRQGNIQIFTKFDALADEDYQAWQNLDLGDLVSVKGEVFTTQKGEISIRNQGYQLLAKCLRPLPEKFHGLTDTDTRYRKRYLDLIVNPEIKEVFEKRSKIITTLRHELEKLDFIEVETPLLNLIAGGAAARPFVTHHNTLDLNLFLRISPELYLKRLIVGGFEKVYEIGRNFRNEGMSTKHNPEFTMIELYQAYTDYYGMMEISEHLISSACMAVNGTLQIKFGEHQLDLTPPFARMTMVEAVTKYTGIDFDTIEDDAAAQIVAQEKGIGELTAGKTRGEIINIFFEEFCEEQLIQPTFIYDYPIEISPLTKKKKSDPRMTERFEIIICGAEYGNAYSELNDPRDQRERFIEQQKQREAGDEEANIPDLDFVEALEYGLPPTGGLGIGIDRLVMLLTDSASIRDVLLFPTMRPLSSQTAENESDNQEDSDTFDPISTEIEKLDLSKVKVEPLFEDLVDFETFSKSDFRVVKVLNCEEVPKSKKLLKFTLDDGSGNERTILSGIKEYYKAEDLIGKTLAAITNLPERKMMGLPSQGMIISAVYEYDGAEGLDLLILDDNIPAGAKLY
ncbi:MAG: lysine--tRNA ligase [Saccharofermentanales bacterium]|jgi:lysyl-tRNA synthetase class 2